MRKNSVRKWLHAILDLLPLFVIPIFAIYTRNENYNSNIEIQVQEEVFYESNVVETYADLRQGNIYQYTDHIIETVTTTNTRIYLNVDFFYTQFPEYENVQDVTIYTEGNSVKMRIRSATNTFLVINNEPFKFIIDYYENIENIDSVLLNHIVYTDYKYSKGIQLVTYNDTDVGSQFVYTLYNATDKYFNCTNLFNLEQVWNWVQLNLFGGNAPIMVYVVWQVIVYEFFMDLIFLLYSVFMFIIDFAQNCLEKPFNRIRRL